MTTNHPTLHFHVFEEHLHHRRLTPDELQRAKGEFCRTVFAVEKQPPAEDATWSPREALSGLVFCLVMGASAFVALSVVAWVVRRLF